MRRRSPLPVLAAVAVAATATLPAAPAAAAAGAACGWQTVPTPRLHGFASLLGVDVLGPRAWAVGAQTRTDLSDIRPLVGRWDGSRWAILPLTVGGSTRSLLAGASAVAPDDVWAVGWTVQGGTQRPLAARWDGSTWQVGLPPGAGGASALIAVDAVSATDAWAVGFTEAEVDAPADPLVEHWDGTAWTVVPVPATFRAEQLNGVKAFRTDDVWAVGSAYPNAGVNRRTLALRWDGVSWSHVPTPNPRPEQNQTLWDVDGVSSTDVWAVGDYSSRHPLALHWDGASWSAIDPPGDGEVVGAAAASATDVRAVGFVGRFGGSATSLVERWNGSSWGDQDPPPADLPRSALSDIAVDGGVYWAVGSQSTSSRSAPFAARSCVA